MARSNAKTSSCFNKANLSVKDIEKLEKAADQYNTGDFNADYAAAVEDMLAKQRELRDAVLAELQKTTDRVGGEAWSRQEQIEIGDYSGDASVITDMDAFREAYPGFAAAEQQLDDLGLTPLMDHIGSVIILEDEYDADGGLHYNYQTGELELLLHRDAFSTPGRLAFAVRHEYGHMVDGAFGPIGLQHYADSIGTAELLTARAESNKATPVGVALEYPFTYVDSTRQREELLGQLFAIATGPTGTTQLPPVLAKFIKGAINAAKSEGASTIEAGRAKAESDYEADLGPNVRKAQVGGDAEGGQVHSGVRQAPQLRPVVATTVSANVPPALRSPLQKLYDNLANLLKKGVYGFAMTSDLADMARDALPSIHQYISLMGQRVATKNKIENSIEEILRDFQRLNNVERGTGELSVNKFLMDSTMTGQWGYGPKADPNSAIAKRYERMSDNAKALIKRVFDHGAETLKKKQELIRAMASEEHKRLIEEAKGDPELLAAAEKARDADLAKFATLLKLSDETPYTPLKRFGPYAVVARSQELLDAMNNGDRSKVAKLEVDGDHNIVSFYETFGEAKAAERELSAANPDMKVFAFEREADRGFLTSGVEMIHSMNRLSKLAKEDLGEDSKAAASIQRLISDLYLSTLSETSARQSERRRRGIAGADKDMMRAFASQGRADAHFIASLQHNAEVTDSLLAMRKESREYTEGKEGRMRIANEVIKRHAMGMDFQPNRASEAMLRASSLWMLSTSPAYYLTNATQTYMLSLPYIAGKFGYGKAWGEITRAYKDLAPMLKGVNLTERMDFSKAPADVRAMVQELINSGAIDIGMDQDLGNFESLGSGAVSDAWNNTNRALRGMQTKLESINRLSTAIAAYRMERNNSHPTPEIAHKIAVEYARKVIQVTHGDYSGINTPRYFRGPVARVVSQFKKFQIVQLGMMARMIGNSFSKNSDEAKIARLQLAFAMAHVSVMAGSLGLPIAAVAQAMLSLFGDPDEPDDLETRMYNAIGDRDIADLLLHGAPSLIGLNLTQRLGMGNILNPVPFGEMPNDRKGMEKLIVAATGPFIGGLLPRFADGVDLINKGDYYRGMEQLMPTGVANAIKVARFNDEGVLKRDGTPLLSKDEIGFAENFSQLLGFPAGKIESSREGRNLLATMEAHFKDRADTIQYRYNRAVASGDSDARDEALADFHKLQAVRMEHGFKPQDVKTLTGGPAKQAQKGARTEDGVPYNKFNQQYVASLRSQ